MRDRHVLFPLLHAGVYGARLSDFLLRHAAVWVLDHQAQHRIPDVWDSCSTTFPGFQKGTSYALLERLALR